MLRRPEVFLFAIAFAAYAWFFQGGGWHANTRLDLVRSIAEDGRLDIDRYRNNSGDLAARDGRYYSDKAPGVAFLATPEHFVFARLAGRGARRPHWLDAALYAMTVWAIGLPCALGVVFLYRLGAVFEMAPALRAALALAWGLATVQFPYATLFYSHPLTAAVLLAAFTLVAEVRHGRGAPTLPRLAAFGALLGFAVAAEYQAVLGVAVLLAYAALAVRPRSRLVVALAAMAVPGLGVAVYHAAAFGGPFHVAYEYSTLPERHATAFMGLGSVSPSVLRALLFDQYRGLFWASPWLLLATSGLVLLLFRPRFRLEAATCLALFALFLSMNAALVDWPGGYGCGPRYLLPAVPFLCVGAAGWAIAVTPRRRRALGIAFAGAAVFSAGLMLAATAVDPEVALDIEEPYTSYLLPAFAEGRLALNTHRVDIAAAPESGPPVAFNLGQKLGLTGLASLAPLILLEALLAAGLVRALSAPRAP